METVLEQTNDEIEKQQDSNEADNPIADIVVEICDISRIARRRRMS